MIIDLRDDNQDISTWPGIVYVAAELAEDCKRSGSWMRGRRIVTGGIARCGTFGRNIEILLCRAGGGGRVAPDGMTTTNLTEFSS